MDKGLLYSGIGHFGLILWVLIGGFFIRYDDAPEIAVTEVSLVSSAEFEAIQAASPTAPAPEAPQVDVATPAPTAAVEQAPDATPQAETPPTVTNPPPQRPEPTADIAPDVVDTAPQPVPATPEDLAPPSPVIAEDVPVLAPTSSGRPRPKPAQRVAPTPTEAPAPDAVTEATPSPAITPEATPEAQVVEEAKPEAAPEEAGTELATEANKAEPLAPSSSSRPKPRPARAAETPRPTPPETQSASSANVPTDAIAEAVAAAVAGGAVTENPTPAAPSGPPMTAGEKEGLRVAVQACWNVGSLSSEALNVTVTVAASLAENGKPDIGSIQMTEFTGGSEGAARQAFEAAKRAIIRCGADGFKLPPEKYDQWRNLELVFNPERMRIK